MQTESARPKGSNFASAGLAQDGGLLWRRAPDLYWTHPDEHGIPVAPVGTSLQVLLVGARKPEQWLELARLVSQNISTQVAADGSAAQCLANKMPFDLILIDVDTSVLDGVFLIARIRRAEAERRAAPRVPVLVFTGLPTPPFEALLRYRGIDDVLKKDASAQVLAGCLQRWCPYKYQLSST